MRSFLTMLGIIIGIASIIAIVSTIKGTSEQIKEDLIGSGNNTVSVSLYSGDSEFDPMFGNSSGTPPILSKEQKQDVMAVSYTHLDVYKRQGSESQKQRRYCICGS